MTGKNIHLRAPEPADIDLLYIWENDETIWHLSNTVEPFSRFALEQYVINATADIYTNKQLRLMIDQNDSGNPVGHIDLFDFDPKNRRAGIGIIIRNEYRNKGFAGEALALLINYCFDELGLHQLYCNITMENETSIRLFEGAGFKQTGVKKEWIQNKNGWMDELFYQLLKTDRIN